MNIDGVIRYKWCEVHDKSWVVQLRKSQNRTLNHVNDWKVIGTRNVDPLAKTIEAKIHERDILRIN